MAGPRVPGVIRSDPFGTCSLDDGTMNRGLTPPPGYLRSANGILQMSLENRFGEVLRRTMPYLPGEMREEFAMMLTPSSLAIIAGTMVVWAGSHYFGVGFVADALLLISGIVLLGWQASTAAQDFVTALQLTTNGKTTDDLDRAARHLANFIAVVGVAAFLALVFKGAKKSAPKTTAVRTAAATDVLVDQLLIKLMGSTKNVGTLVRQNVKLTAEFLSRKGISPEKMPEILRGIDLHSPVTIELLTKGTKLTQRVSGSTGRWFSKRGVSERNLGISSSNRQYQVFEVTQYVEVIQSKAAGISDTWTQGRTRDVYSPNSAAGIDQPKLKAGELTSGGGLQYFIPEGDAVVK